MAALQGYVAEEDHPIEQVRLTVPATDDPSLPAFTFRTLVLGILSCVLLNSMSQFFSFRRYPIAVGLLLVQIVAVPAGRLMAATLPTRAFRVPLTGWRFTLNPGPFNMKEHVLIATLGIGGFGSAATDIIASMKSFYHRPLNPWAALLLIISTKMIGYGFAGMFKRFLVDSPYMWWPVILVDVSFYRTLNEKEVRKKGQLGKLQFFILVSVLSFAYYIIPNYFFPSISAISFVCLIWKGSVTAHQLGSGVSGLGVGSFTLDWNVISGILGSPLSLPPIAILNSMVGFIILVYIITPITYWSNAFNSKRFAIFSTKIFDENGQVYDLSRVLKKNSFEFDAGGYQSYSKVYLSAAFACQYGFNFAALSSTLCHVLLYHGRTFWKQLKVASAKQTAGDIHSRMMEKYDSVPQWWFHLIWISAVGLAILTCEGFGKQLQLPYWGVLLAVFLSFILILPVLVLTATTGQGLALNIISEIIIGYMYPGRPLANLSFKVYCISTMDSANNFIADFKLGQYLKIPPRSMFLAQILGAIISSLVEFGVTWWLFSSVKNICRADLLPKGSPWTCPLNNTFSNVMALWGIIGPSNIFYPHGIYSKLYLFFIVGAISPLLVWISSHIFPQKTWIKSINIPNIFIGGNSVPPFGSLNYWSWGVVGLFFNYFVYKRFRGWWIRYNYILSVALEVGIAAMALLASFALQLSGINGVNWWGLEASDHCPLASCPTAPNIRVDGCPTF